MIRSCCWQESCLFYSSSSSSLMLTLNLENKVPCHWGCYQNQHKPHVTPYTPQQPVGTALVAYGSDSYWLCISSAAIKKFNGVFFWTITNIHRIWRLICIPEKKQISISPLIVVWLYLKYSHNVAWFTGGKDVCYQFKHFLCSSDWFKINEGVRPTKRSAV